MRLQFINHSGYVLRHGDVALFVDPWIDGRVFNNGWALITPSPFSSADFENITHIWFSHEHPDHFNPPNLAKIPPAVRARITVLFQETRDKRVVDACKKFGFGKVIEMAPDQWVRLGPDVEAMCENYAENDSWLAVRTPGELHLNTNDCGIRDRARAREIARKLGRPDILLSQFSYAFWAGNPEDRQLRRQMAEDKLYGLRFQCEELEPRYVVPIASYVRFCHLENSYLNDLINTPRACHEYLQKNTRSTPVILYPGDEYTVGEAHDNGPALARYDADFARVQKHEEPLVERTNVDFAALQEQARVYVEKLASNPWSRVLLRRPATLFLWDYGHACKLDLNNGLTRADVPEDECDVALGAESLQYCFKFPWGQDTLGVNGRFRKPHGGNYSRFYNFFRFEQLRSRGVEVDLPYLLGAGLRQAYQRLGLDRYRSEKSKE